MKNCRKKSSIDLGLCAIYAIGKLLKNIWFWLILALSNISSEGQNAYRNSDGICNSNNSTGNMVTIEQSIIRQKKDIVL